MKGKAKTFAGAAMIAFAATVVMLALSQTQLISLLHLKAGDLYFVLSPVRKVDGVVLIVVDQKSLDQFSEPLLLWHKYYAEAIEAAAAAGAKVLGLDVAFPIPVDQWAPGYDERMAEAVINASARMPVLCGYAASTLANQRQWPVPMNMAASALDQMVYVNLRADEDDFIRSIELYEPAGSKSMSLGVAEKMLGRPVRPAEPMMLIRYAGPANTVPRVSISDFLAAARSGNQQQLKKWVGGKAVLLGPDLITDRHATPFYALQAGAGANTAGVEIHANAVSTLITGHGLHRMPAASGLALSYTAALAAAVLTSAIAGWPLVGWLSLFALFSVFGGYWLFQKGVMLAPSELVLPLLTSLLLSLVFNYFSAARGREAFRRAVKVFVGKQVADTLDATGAISLTGRRELITILFTDIRGFTAWCDSQEPEMVVARLNEYFTMATGSIVRHGGNVNKFIGDGILAIFSDAEGAHLGDHAARAVRCALEIVRHPAEFRTGAGIHTGEAVVGNVGSGDKMEYTALGDAVNLASRLESLNKQFGTSLLMSEATWLRVKDEVKARRLGEVAVRGISAQQALFTVLEE